MNKIEQILEGYKNDVLTYIDREGEHQVNIYEFIKTGGIQVLQKLNRTEDVLVKLANKAPEKLKWVNDYAMCQVVKKLYDRIDDLSHGIIEKDTEIERLKNESVASQVSLETRDGITKEEADKLVERIDWLEADSEALREELNIEASYKEKAETERDSIQQKYDELNKQFVELQKEKTDLEQECNTYAGELEKTIARYNELNSNYDLLNDRCNKHENLIEDLEKAHDEDCNEIHNLREELDNVKNGFGEATDKIRTLDSTNVELQNKVTEQDNLINGLNDTILSVNNEKTELQASLEEKTKENALLAAKIKNSENTNERMKVVENAINEFLKTIGWESAKNEHSNNVDKQMHRMGDNQTVNFNIGM